METKFVHPGNSKEKVGKEIPQYSLLIDNLETSLSTTVDKSCGNIGGAIVERFIKPIASTMFIHLVYFMEGPGPPISILGPYEECFNSDFKIWIGGNLFSDGCYIPISIHKVWMSFGLRKHIVEQL